MSGIMMMVLGGVGGPPPPPPLPTIGSAYGGGFFAGQISTAANGIATHNLVVGPRSTAQSPSNIAWSSSTSSLPGASSTIDGPANTAAMIADGTASYPAAQFCVGLSVGGFSDWYMPALNELDVCYFNLKPSTDSNETQGPSVGGINPNAVPSRNSTYTSGVPAQTSAADFQSGNSESFTSDFSIFGYWTSTEDAASAFAARLVNFRSGQRGTAFKTYAYYCPVRAIRRVTI